MKYHTLILIMCFLILLFGCDKEQEKESIIVEGAAVQKIETGFSFTEGPAVDAKGNVYFTDQPNNSIYKWNAVTNQVTLFSDSVERANGTYFTDQGKLLACADLYGRIISIDTSTGSYQTILEDYKGKQFNGPNDLWIDLKGGIYFTDPYYQRPYWERTEPEIEEQRVYYLSPDDSLFIVADDLVQPNGIIGTADGKYLYVADFGAKKTYRYEIQPDGSLKNKKLFAPEGSDGMTVDSESNVYLTNETVAVYNSDGEKIENIRIPETPSNVTFGGTENNILFITARTSVYKLEMNVKGMN